MDATSITQDTSSKNNTLNESDDITTASLKNTNSNESLNSVSVVSDSSDLVSSLNGHDGSVEDEINTFSIKSNKAHTTTDEFFRFMEFAFGIIWMITDLRSTVRNLGMSFLYLLSFRDLLSKKKDVVFHEKFLVLNPGSHTVFSVPKNVSGKYIFTVYIEEDEETRSYILESSIDENERFTLKDLSNKEIHFGQGEVKLHISNDQEINLCCDEFKTGKMCLIGL
jgi:hypothetical protein